LNPLIKVPCRQASDISRQVRLTVDQPAELHELIRSERVWIVARRAGLRNVLQAAGVCPEVVADRPLGWRSNAIAPVVAIGETSARPANYRAANRLHRIHERFADAVNIRDLRVGSDPDAVVHDAAQVLNELAVQQWAHRSDGFVDEYLDLGIGGPSQSR